MRGRTQSGAGLVAGTVPTLDQGGGGGQLGGGKREFNHSHDSSQQRLERKTDSNGNLKKKSCIFLSFPKIDENNFESSLVN